MPNLVLRRFALYLALLLLPWLIIALVPRFRLQLGLTLSGQHLALYGTPWTRIFNPSPQPSWVMTDENPTTLAGKALRIRSGGGAGGNPEEWKILQFGRLSDQHPREVWIVALALREMSSTRDGRREYWEATGYFPPKETSVYTRAMIREGYRLVRRGQSLEPDNAFFDWMEIHLLLVQRRDREALELLQRAVHKPVYNEHIGEVMAVQITSWEERRPLFPDERIVAVSAVTFPDWSLGHHMRRLLLWRVSQLEEAGRHDEAIAVGRALRRLSIMQMRASPTQFGSLMVGAGLVSVWTSGPRRTSAIPRATKQLLDVKSNRYTNFLAHRYFQYLSEHGHRELLPEARGQLAEYRAMRAKRLESGHDQGAGVYRNAPWALANVAWSLGGWCFAGVLIFGLIYLLLLPVGLRSVLRDAPAYRWPPARGTFYPQLLGWSGAVLCMGYAGYLQFFETYNTPGVDNGLNLVAPAMMLSYSAFALPLAAAVANQMLVRRDGSVEEPGSQWRWVPGWRELGMPEEFFTLLVRCWSVFTKVLFAVGLLCTPLSIAWIFGVRPFSWHSLAGMGVFALFDDFPLWLPVETVQLTPPVLVGLWVLFRFVRWAVFARRAERVVTFGAVRDFRRCCGTYATVFSWLLLFALMANLPIQTELDGSIKRYLAQTTQWTRVTLTEPAPAPKAIRALPAIPVFPTPTPTFVPAAPWPDDGS